LNEEAVKVKNLLDELSKTKKSLEDERNSHAQVGGDLSE